MSQQDRDAIERALRKQDDQAVHDTARDWSRKLSHAGAQAVSIHDLEELERSLTVLLVERLDAREHPDIALDDTKWVLRAREIREMMREARRP